MNFHSVILLWSNYVEFTGLHHQGAGLSLHSQDSAQKVPALFTWQCDSPRNDGTLTAQVAQVKVTVTRNSKHSEYPGREPTEMVLQKQVEECSMCSGTLPQAATNIAGLGLRGWRALTELCGNVTPLHLATTRTDQVAAWIVLGTSLHRWMIKPH